MPIAIINADFLDFRFHAHQGQFRLASVSIPGVAKRTSLEDVLDGCRFTPPGGGGRLEQWLTFVLAAILIGRDFNRLVGQ